MKRILLALIALSFIYTSFSYGFTKLDKIVAIVNREAITQSELTKEMDKLQQQLEHTNQPVPSRAELRKEVLDKLIAKSLQLQLSKSNGIKITDEDVNKAMETIAKANHISVTQLQQAVNETGISTKEYSAQIKEQLLLQKIQQEQVAKNVSMTPDDVKKFMRENKDKLNQYGSYHIIDVVLPAAENTNADQVNQVKKQAEELAKQIKNNEIDTILTQYPTAERNDMGWRALAEFPSLFQSKVATMRLNAVSPPIQAPNGFHVLKLVEVRGENAQPSEKDIKNLVFQQKAQEAIKSWVEKLKKDAYIRILN